jgi:dihydrosphingosine 1-phosphate phosphatase
LGAKQLFHFVLPPTFRALTPYLTLPRRHYTQATEYTKYENNESDLHPVPSVINLPSLSLDSPILQNGDDMSWEGQLLRRRRQATDLKSLREKKFPKKEVDFEQGITPPKKKIKHYDVDGKCFRYDCL